MFDVLCPLVVAPCLRVVVSSPGWRPVGEETPSKPPGDDVGTDDANDDANDFAWLLALGLSVLVP